MSHDSCACNQINQINSKLITQSTTVLVIMVEHGKTKRNQLYSLITMKMCGLIPWMDPLKSIDRCSHGCATLMRVHGSRFEKHRFYFCTCSVTPYSSIRLITCAGKNP